MPWGDDVLLFRIENKIYMAMSLDSTNPHITVKCNPEKAILQRERYQAVEPAFHWNKKYWNDLYLKRDMNEQEIIDCIIDSYHEVINYLKFFVKSMFYVE